jgi:hypothetical protein
MKSDEDEDFQPVAPDSFSYLIMLSICAIIFVAGVFYSIKLWQSQVSYQVILLSLTMLVPCLGLSFLLIEK